MVSVSATTKAKHWLQYFRLLVPVSKEAWWRFDKKGMRTFVKDASRVQAVEICLDAESFEEYEFPSEQEFLFGLKNKDIINFVKYRPEECVKLCYPAGGEYQVELSTKSSKRLFMPAELEPFNYSDLRIQKWKFKAKLKVRTDKLKRSVVAAKCVDRKLALVTGQDGTYITAENEDDDMRAELGRQACRSYCRAEYDTKLLSRMVYGIPAKTVSLCWNNSGALKISFEMERDCAAYYLAPGA